MLAGRSTPNGKSRAMAEELETEDGGDSGEGKANRPLLSRRHRADWRDMLPAPAEFEETSRAPFDFDIELQRPGEAGFMSLR